MADEEKQAGQYPSLQKEAVMQADLVEKLEKLTAALSKDKPSHNEVFTKALDDLVNVNSLFTVAVFIGLSVASRDEHSLEGKHECDASPEIGKQLVLFEIVSFGCFLLSSLIAKTMKVHLNVIGSQRFEQSKEFRMGRGFMFLSSVLTAVAGVVFLTLSMIHVIQVKVGRLSCGSNEAVAAVIALCVLVTLSVVVYLPSMLFPIISSMSPEDMEPQKKQSTA